MRTGTEEELRGTGFRFKPAGPFALRDYSNDDPDDLKKLLALIDEIRTGHKLLIPGQLTRLMRAWRADLSKAVQARVGETGTEASSQDPPTDRPAQTAVGRKA
jgi:hypothetical protein